MTLQGLDRLAPFGIGNPRPVFDAAGVEVVSGPTRVKDRHLTMTLQQGGRIFRAIAWRAAEQLEFFEAHRTGFDLAYHLEKNTFRGEENLEIQIADARNPQ